MAGRGSFSRCNKILFEVLVAGEDKDPTALMTSADATSHCEKQAVELVLSFNTSDDEVASLQQTGANVDAILSMVNRKKLLTALAVILHIVGDERGQGGCTCRFLPRPVQFVIVFQK